MTLYLFDFDKTLYGHTFLHRLPALSRSSGVSQYALASTSWAGGVAAPRRGASYGHHFTDPLLLDEAITVFAGRKP